MLVFSGRCLGVGDADLNSFGGTGRSSPSANPVLCSKSSWSDEYERNLRWVRHNDFSLSWFSDSFLEELADKKRRDRLWSIYLGSTDDSSDRLTRAETTRIRRIKKQLATINRTQRLTQDNLFSETSSVRATRKRLKSCPTPVIASSTLQRHSSFDQPTLEQWKQLARQRKTSEQLPSVICRLISRRSTKKGYATPKHDYPHDQHPPSLTWSRDWHALSVACQSEDRFFRKDFSWRKKRERKRR